jgi:riboflavin synthase
MFTGLIQDLGRVVSIERRETSALLTIESNLLKEIAQGDSVAVNGVCLTALSPSKLSFTADVMIQTLRLTSLGSLVEGSLVNLELATTLQSRLGGHMVQGHVDGVAEVVATEASEKWWKFVVKVPDHLKRYIVNQGSVAIDGVSLTVGEIDDSNSQLTLWLIPETLAKTNLSQKKIGEPVNVEVDLIAKYVERLISQEGK